jgi:hypothetical protein
MRSAKRKRLLKGRGRAGEDAVNRRGQSQTALGLLNRASCLAERHARCKVEGDSDGRKLPLVIDRQRGVGRAEMDQCGERNLFAAGDHIDAVERIGIGLEARINFHHHVILVQLLVDGRNLPLAQGVVETTMCLTGFGRTYYAPRS